MIEPLSGTLDDLTGLERHSLSRSHVECDGSSGRAPSNSSGADRAARRDTQEIIVQQDLEAYWKADALMKSYRKDASSIWPLLTIFDLAQVNNREQLVTTVQVAYGLANSDARIQVDKWAAGKDI
jgi:hypothetical protein